MPPPRRPPQEESESESDDQGNVMDFARFTNPNYAREFKAKLPEKIRDRVKALEALDEDYKKLRLEQRAATEAAEREFQEAIKPHAAARLKILNGEVEPTEDEVKAGLPAERADEIHLDGAVGGTKGIPNFWLQALQHHVIIREFISERDEEALGYLTDIACQTFEGSDEGYTVVFHFAPNPFFTNETLSKTFTLSRQQDEIVLSKATGTKVEWKEGKNLGLRTVTKKVKSKAKKGQTKFVTSEEPCDTFFDFFAVAEEGAEEEGQEEEWMALADTLKDKIIPFAVDYFTGDAPNGESDLEDDDDYGDEDEEEEEEEEEAPMPTRGGRGGYNSAPAGPSAGGAKRGGRGGGQQDCKQQ